LLLRARSERPNSRATEKRDELAPFELTKLHPLPLARATTIANWRGSSQGLAAMRHFGPALDRFGSMLLKKSSMISPSPSD